MIGGIVVMLWALWVARPRGRWLLTLAAVPAGYGGDQMVDVMAHDSQYLGRNLTGRVKDTVTAFQHEMLAIKSQAVAAGAINSSRVYIQYWTKGLEVLRKGINDAAQFAYGYSGEHTGEVYDQVAFAAKRMVDEMMNAITADAGQRIDNDGVVAKTRMAFEELRDRLLDDFKNGMMGSGKLKKDPVVSIIANQTGSPGAIQQIGVGGFSQTAFVENNQTLVKAIDDAMLSSEFNSLQPEQKDGFRDIADVVKGELSKPTPDVGCLKRWGKRLVEFGTDVGMKTVSSTIASVLAKMFTGG